MDTNRPYAQVLEEQWTNGPLSATTGYVYGDDLISRTTNGATHYYHYDGLCSTRTLTDTTGAVTDTYSYNAYGILLDKTGSTSNPYLYRGEQYDADLSSYYLRARYYQPGIGRFLTTDPVQGFPTEPLSQHRYLYGNCNPVNYIDPSGRRTYSLNETIVTAGIVLNLAAIGIGNFTEAGRQAYADFGEYYFPDAFILGGTFSIGFIQALFGGVGAGGVLPFFPGDRNFMVGVEFLFSVSSGEIAPFYTPAKGFEIGKLPFSPLGLEIYRGMVWNLWNANNYEGPFHSVSISGGPIGVSIFCDAKNYSRGPWGISRSVWSAPKNNKVSLGYYYIDYRDLFMDPIKPPSEGDVVTLILATIYISNHHINSQAIGNPVDILRLTVNATLWIQTGFAKYYWNRSSTGYDLETRRNHDRDEFPHFQSGPGLFRVENLY